YHPIWMFFLKTWNLIFGIERSNRFCRITESWVILVNDCLCDQSNNLLVNTIFEHNFFHGILEPVTDTTFRHSTTSIYWKSSILFTVSFRLLQQPLTILLII